VSGFDVVRDTIVMAQASLTSGAQLYKFKLGGTADKAQQLTQLNAQALADVKFGEYEQFSFTGANGDTVRPRDEAMECRAGREISGRLPGTRRPAGQLRNSWSYRWNPQVYAGAGYATVFIDFHGSTGYGQKFTDSISGDWGGKPLEDLQKGLAAAVQKFPWLDREQLRAGRFLRRLHDELDRR
jgi:dipeptidyl aminopeptidase/acylaminoacyl peptidase